LDFSGTSIQDLFTIICLLGEELDRYRNETILRGFVFLFYILEITTKWFLISLHGDTGTVHQRQNNYQDPMKTAIINRDRLNECILGLYPFLDHKNTDAFQKQRSERSN
jgi:hypothetical protein